VKGRKKKYRIDPRDRNRPARASNCTEKNTSKSGGKILVLRKRTVHGK